MVETSEVLYIWSIEEDEEKQGNGAGRDTSGGVEGTWGEGVDLLQDLMVKIEEQDHIPDEWRESVLVRIYKEKGDVQECQNYRGIKLLSHTMKIWERILDKRVRGEVEVAEEQFGFMPGRGTTNAIFILRQMAEKYREKGWDLHMVFIDLEKA